VEQGTAFGFLGPNGSGKTTLMHILLGFLNATGGEAWIFGDNVKKSIARQRIGYLPEHPQSYPFLTGQELLDMAGRIFGLRGKKLRDRREDLVEMVGLNDAARRRISTYSRGMLQRIGLAQALMNDPELVILDEPTNGLDPVARLDVRCIIETLRGLRKTVFFSSHELSEVELVCDHIAILSKGKIAVQGKASELIGAGQRLEPFFLEVVQAGEAA
jgi:ABC-2 type transport system ATP-binding protein